MNELTADSSRAAVLRGSWRKLPVADRGEGIYLFDVDGRRYLDGAAGSSVVVNIGHGVRPVIEAMYAQMQKVSFAAPHVFANEPLLKLAEVVAERDARVHRRWLTLSRGARSPAPAAWTAWRGT